SPDAHPLRGLICPEPDEAPPCVLRSLGAVARAAAQETLERRDMLVGVPKEVKTNESRVSMPPSGVHELPRRGHDVVVQASAGVGCSIPDEEFVAAGAKILATADDVWE